MSRFKGLTLVLVALLVLTFAFWGGWGEESAWALIRPHNLGYQPIFATTVTMSSGETTVSATVVQVLAGAPCVASFGDDTNSGTILNVVASAGSIMITCNASSGSDRTINLLYQQSGAR